VWQRYRGRKLQARNAFWWPHAPIAAIDPGQLLTIALPEAAIVHWGRDGWQDVADNATEDTGLGFHAAALPTAALLPGASVNFTWRFRDNGEWAGRDETVLVAPGVA
jgi:glucoamylase